MRYSNNGEHIFVVGSARSGTSLTASIINSSQSITCYQAESKVLTGCKEKYGDLSGNAAKKKFLGDFLQSRQFKRSGLTAEEIKTLVWSQESYIAFLGNFMGVLTQNQGCDRWVDSTPDNAFFLKEIAESFPNANVVHVIRDGRAVAMSLAKLGWSGVRTSDYDNALLYASLKWEDSVKEARNASVYLGNRYLELKYEELVQAPTDTITELFQFLGLSMPIKRIQNGKHARETENERSTLHTPNSPFGDVSSGISKNAAIRWMSSLTSLQICRIEAHVGGMLETLGYPRTCDVDLPRYYSLVPVWRRSVLQLKQSVKRAILPRSIMPSPLEIGLD